MKWKHAVWPPSDAVFDATPAATSNTLSFYSTSRNLSLKMNFESSIPRWNRVAVALLIRKDNSYSFHLTWVLNIEIIVANCFVLKVIFVATTIARRTQCNQSCLRPLCLVYRNVNLFHFRKSRAPNDALFSQKSLFYFLNSDWLLLNESSQETFFHFSSINSVHNSNCYYKQDLYFWKIHVSSRKKHFCSIPKHHSTNEIDYCAFDFITKFNLLVVLATFIFRARQFDWWVVTHSLAGSDFHGHRPIVLIDEHLLWYL
jgi:hypothetical protein